MINNRIWGPDFNKKEAEIRQLKAELARIDADKAQPSLLTKTQSIPIPAPLFTSYKLFYNLLNNPFMINSLVSPISIISFLFHYQKLLHQKDPNQKSESQNLHPRKIQLTNTIINRLTLTTMTPIQPQRKVYPPQIISAHLHKLLQTQSLNMLTFLVFSWP